MSVAVARGRTWLLTGNSPVKIGIIVSLIGLGFLLREAAVRGWVDFTIETRLAAATVFGLGLLGFGWHQRARRPIYGRSLQGGGIAVLYLVTLAAYAVYELLPPLAALAAVVLITVTAGALAMIQSSLTLAMLGLIGGFSAPLLAFGWPRDHFEVFGFYAVLGVAVVVVARRMEWPILVLSGYGFTFVVAVLWLFAREAHNDWGQLQPFVVFFVLLYSLVPLAWPPVSSSRDEPVGFKDAWVTPLVFGTPFAGLAMQTLLVGHLRYGVAVSSGVLAVVHAVFQQLSRRRTSAGKQIEVAHAALAVVFCATAVPLFLGASATSAIWAAQGAVLVWASSRWGSRLALLGGCVLQAIAAVAYGVRFAADFEDWDGAAVFGFWAEATPLLNVYSLGAVMLTASGLASAESLRRSSHFESWRPRMQSGALVWGAGWFLFAETAAVWLRLGLLPTVGLWSVQGAVLMWVASRRRSLPVAVVGIAMQVAAAVAAALKMIDDADSLSPGSFEFWADTLPVVNPYFAVTAFLAVCGLASATAVSRFAGDRDDAWGAVMFSALALGGGWFLFAESAEMWVRLGLLPTVGLWSVQGAALMWVTSRRRSLPVAVVGIAMQVAAAVAAALKMIDDADSLSPGSFEFWADTLPVVNPYFAVTAFLAVCGLASATAVSRFAGDRDDAWGAVMYSALVLGGGWLLFAESAEMWVRVGPFAVSALWAVQGAALMWVASRRRIVLGAVLGTLLQFAAAGVYTVWSVEARLVGEGADRSSALSFWADETPMLNQYFGVAVLLACAGIASAVIVYRSSSALGALRVPMMWMSLLWGVGWWLFAAAAQIWVATDNYRLWGLSLLVIGTLSAVVAAGRALKWNELEWAGVLMLPALVIALAIAVVNKDYPSADWGWTAWPFMILAFAVFLRTGGDKLPATGLYGGLYCVLSVFLAAEVYGQLAQTADGQWPLYGAAAAVLLWLEVSLRARPVASRLVGDGWRCSLLYGITPIVWTAAAGAGIAVVRHHGNVDPLLFLPILNPIDVFAAASVILLLRWKREMVVELSVDSDGLTPAIGSLLRLAATPWLPALSAAGVAALTMSAARSVHHWAGVPFELRPLGYSTELQVAVSILWAATALAAMVVGVRAADRRVWIVGASWMGVVVIKLFLIDLSSLAALPKAASFIGVGILLLIVGYLAPVPPSQSEAEISEDDPETHDQSASGTAV